MTAGWKLPPLSGWCDESLIASGVYISSDISLCGVTQFLVYGTIFTSRFLIKCSLPGWYYWLELPPFSGWRDESQKVSGANQGIS